MSDDQIVILSNRLPVHRVSRGDGDAWETSPGGLVSALTPLLRDRPCMWIGWSGWADHDFAPFSHDGIDNHPVPLSAVEVESFYEGFANKTLWPLYHDAIRPPEYHRRWWQAYLEVNRRFADVAIEQMNPNGTVWVHDYHLQIVPAMIRKRHPKARIGFFLHIPFPPQELFAQLPWRTQILEGLLGSDVVGFQTPVGAQNFARLAKRFTEARGARSMLTVGERTVQASAFPISIDIKKYEQPDDSEAIRTHTQKLRKMIGGPRKVILGVDRLDYTKGIDLRLRAFREMLAAGQISAEQCAMIQVAVPSREHVEDYQQLRSKVEQLVGEINGEYGSIEFPAVYYLHRSFPPDELIALYRLADVMLVTPFRDGMNLVAKEFVASRVDNRGVLVLSEFTGAARALRSALFVNPHDIEGVSATLYQALQMPLSKQRTHMAALRRAVKKYDVFQWAGQFLDALAESGNGRDVEHDSSASAARTRPARELVGAGAGKVESAG